MTAWAAPAAAPVTVVAPGATNFLATAGFRADVLGAVGFTARLRATTASLIFGPTMPATSRPCSFRNRLAAAPVLEPTSHRRDRG
jgi:hypothetical protein